MKDWLVREDIEKQKKEYLKNIDPYIDYIESLSQYEAAKERNRNFSKLASFCDELLSNLDSVVSSLKDKGLDTCVEYRKGYFRILFNGRYLYRKCDILYKR